MKFPDYRAQLEMSLAAICQIEASRESMAATFATHQASTVAAAAVLGEFVELRNSGYESMRSAIKALQTEWGPPTTFHDSLAELAKGLRDLRPEMYRPLSAVALDGFRHIALMSDSSMSSFGVVAGLLQQQSLESMRLTALAAEGVLAHLPWESLGARLEISPSARWSLQHAAMRLQRRYQDLSVPQESDDSDVCVDAPLSVLAHGQSLQIISATALVVGVRAEVIETTFEFVERQLDAHNPKWADMLRGARERAVLRGPDWPRHWASSYRQLFKNILHTAAPSEVVKAWVSEKSDLDVKGFPKRRTKVRWLCRNEAETQRRFLVEDIDSALGVLGVLEETVHEDGTDIVESEFHWLSLRVEKAMHDILRLWQRG